LNYTIGKKSHTCFLDNFKALFPVLGITQDSKNLQNMPDYQTLIYLLKKINPNDIEKVLIKNIRYLIRKKTFQSHRLMDKWYTLAIDGSQLITFKKRHCKHCLRRKIGQDDQGQIIYEYYHYIVSVSLVSPDGICMPVLTEFVENETPDVKKQDCELKAFYRIAVKLKNYFPKMKICLLLDSLFAGKPVMDICKKNDWKYIICFKKGSIPNLYKEYEALQDICTENRQTKLINAHIFQDYSWVNDINYEGHYVHVINCLETNKQKNKATKFVHITNISINFKNYNHISKGGRCRWIQENQGFNCQKNGGFNLEHLYAKDNLAIKNFILFLLIGFSISHLIEKSSLVKNIKKAFGSFREFTRKFLIAFTQHCWNFSMLNLLDTSYQIRLDSS